MRLACALRAVGRRQFSLYYRADNGGANRSRRSERASGQFDFYRAARRQASWTVHTRADGHIVIAARARIENQIGVVETDAIASGGRCARSSLPARWRAGTALGRGRAEARRTALLAREIGTTLLFIARLFLPLDATSIS